MSETTTEAEFLKSTISELEDDGYEVFLQPQSPILPPFLKSFRPDAIARRNGKHLVVEIVSSLGQHEKTFAAMASAIGANPGWELRVVVVSPTSRPNELSKQPIQAIRESVAEVSKLADAQSFRAALLMGWSAFEAVARSAMPSNFARPQSPGRLVQQLAQEGYITPAEADTLRQLANKRNVLIHGDVQTEVNKAEVDAFVSIVGKLIEMQAATA